MRLRDTGLTAEELKEMVNKYMVETYERYDFIAERAEGMYLYDEKGMPYLDFYGGVAVNSPGNCNPEVVKAAKDQMDDIMHTFNYPYTIPQALLAKKVCETIGMDKIFYQNSGTEANECMIKMARKYGTDHYGPEKYHMQRRASTAEPLAPWRLPDSRIRRSSRGSGQCWKVFPMQDITILTTSLPRLQRIPSQS